VIEARSTRMYGKKKRLVPAAPATIEPASM
jgi:hypothetical protein